jgi:hypothetical protein
VLTKPALLMPLLRRFPCNTQAAPNGPVTIARGAGDRKARKSQAPQYPSAAKASARLELKNSQDSERTSTVQDFLQRKWILRPISPIAILCCNPTLKIGVVLSLGMGDATALQSKQQTG